MPPTEPYSFYVRVKAIDRAGNMTTDTSKQNVIVDLTVQDHWKQIIDMAMKSRLPTVSGPQEFVEAGGLVAYGPDFSDLFRRAATYVDKIFKGTKPADLPVEKPTIFELALNMKTAKALGLKVPQAILIQATKVIE